MFLVNSFTDISLIMVVCGEDASWAVGNVFVAVDQRLPNLPNFCVLTQWFLSQISRSEESMWQIESNFDT